MKILITGGAGSVGKELTQRLVALGHHVRVFDLPVCDFSSLEAMPNVEILRGDIGDVPTVQRAVAGMACVLHLAALLPFASEKDRSRTFAVNVEGTRHLADSIRAAGGKTRLVFSSTVATYGSTMDADPPIRVDHHQTHVDIYGESKIAAEQVILGAGIPYTILRISGIVIPAFLEPPDPYPFMRDQRMEFVDRADVVTALLEAVQRPQAANKVFNIAGGRTWQMRGHEYVEQVFALLGVPPEEAHYRQTPWWSDWYDTTESQAVLQYQNTPFAVHLEHLDKAIQEALG
jgi:UDP-glucose 4-epimerase